MKAMILAAGLGTRLLPLTQNHPKALIKVNGKPLIEHVLLRLTKFGVKEVIINLHHFPDQIKEFLKSKNYFGIQIHFSFEENLLDTGGGLKKASFYFDDNQPFLLHNVDILSNIDLLKLQQQHIEFKNLVTLAVQKRETSRYLIFDENKNLSGWKSVKENKIDWCKESVGATVDYGFCGIHILSPEIFSLMEEDGAFSIIKFYLRIASLGKKIQAFSADQYNWNDLGKKEILAKYS
jgi:N-acetyl-alpha-D-muramate 1-phosphate uridylyltransferase